MMSGKAVSCPAARVGADSGHKVAYELRNVYDNSRLSVLRA